MHSSEFSDEYQDWLDGSKWGVRQQFFDRSLADVEEATVVSVRPSDSVHDVVQRMNSEKVGGVLILQGGELVGIFTERDVLTRVVGPGLDPTETRVGAVMTPNPETLPEESVLAHALRVMVLGGFRHVPVVDAAGKPVATVSMRRIIHFVSEMFAKEVLNAPPVRQSWPTTAEGA